MVGSSEGVGGLAHPSAHHMQEKTKSRVNEGALLRGEAQSICAKGRAFLADLGGVGGRGCAAAHSSPKAGLPGGGFIDEH